ncbi:MAG: ABC transporter ATP-binding protein [Ectothiorhodospiraceae bacterium]|nr:ABC transporter ATP-binding protein [Ectothiorhodospiraceae bacterium]
MLEAHGVGFSYPGIRVLQDINLTVEAGERHAIIGPNGAGKTTLFKVLSGEDIAQEGTVTYQGQDVTRKGAWERVKLGFGRTFQVARVFPEMTVLDNMIVALECRQRIRHESGGPWWKVAAGRLLLEEARERLAEVRLGGVADDEAGILSHGDKKRLELGLSLALEPRILLLDEPTAGMSPDDRKEVVQLLKGLQEKRDLTLLLTEHDMDVVFGLATRLTVLSLGQILASGDPEQVRKEPVVREVYLGQRH